MKKWFLLLLACSLVLSLTACGGSSSDSNSKDKPKTTLLDTPYSKTEFLMGTEVTLKIYDKGKEDVLDKAFDRVEQMDKEITVNDDGKDSEVDKINQAAGKEPVKVSDDVFYLVKKGLEYSENSGGSFDITIGPLTSLWHIGFSDARKPSQEEIDAVLPLIDYHNVELDEDAQTVYLTKEGMELDLGGIAKGYITDEVNKIFAENDVTTGIIDLGGNIYVRGNSPKADDGKWTVGIQDPFSPRGEIIGTIPEKNRSIVTSGIYERYVEVDGVKYHHILNPKTGYPYDNDIAGVSIISDKSIDGDGLSTATFSKGIEGGMDYIEQFDGVEAIFVSKEKKVYVTSGLKDTFKLTNDDFEMAEMK
ncbi:FAD:protein FMN transferase [Listeria costaricensis]|uniref:FAD:protein FMN transferase n=1 Tax=Listeria costaricensis TaxID=2026604 RepID=UPI000C073C2B|nr:FAD:protein FMN transferase [Listeria costaricensis]